MEQKTFTNRQVIGYLDAMCGRQGQALREKNLPFQILYALRRSMPELQKAYQAYNATLQDICDKYDVSPKEAMQSENEACKTEVTALLDMEVSVPIHRIQPEMLEACDGTQYSALTFNDVDRLWWLVDAPEETTDENPEI